MVKRGRPTIALIEDELLLRVATAKAIDDAGYNVVSAASGVEGLALLRDYAIDLAVIDIVLPGRLDGVGMIREARRENPHLSVIFTSGVPPVDAAAVTAIGPFLLKPYRMDALVALIARLVPLDAKRW